MLHLWHWCCSSPNIMVSIFRNISYVSVTYVTFACFHCLYDCSICNDLHAYFVWMDDCQSHLFSICHVLLVTKSDIVTFIICSILKRHGFAWMDVRIIVFVWWMTVFIIGAYVTFCMCFFCVFWLPYGMADFVTYVTHSLFSTIDFW